MRWEKLGLVWKPEGNQAWARSHASVPTPLLLSNGVIRVYVTCLDGAGRGRPTYVDLAAQNPARVVGTAGRPLLEPGEPGAFDDNGVMPISVLAVPDGRIFMYYS